MQMNKKNVNLQTFALMFKNIESIQEYLHVNQEEEALLKSWRKPRENTSANRNKHKMPKIDEQGEY